MHRNQHHNQHHNQNLLPVTVGPGIETGLYYIPIGNLSHSTTWRDLKAFASQACEVDHAAVYSPTAGFVRVKGLANFEKAFRHLDGNTLDYRALQADGRNKCQETIVKLPPTDYHAARILRNETGRVFNEPQAPSPAPSAQIERCPQGVAPGMSSSPLDYHGSTSPAFSIPHQMSIQWAYSPTPSFVTEGYSVTTTAVTTPGSMVYQPMADLPYGFPHHVVTSPHLTFPQPPGYQAGPVSSAAHSPTSPYLYGTPDSYFPPGASYAVAGPGYTGYSEIQPPGKISCHPYAPGYGEAWPVEAVQPPQCQIVNYGSEVAGVVIEQRKIIILKLQRDGLSKSTVLNLIAEHAGIGAIAGEIERVELPFNNDGKARGIAFVTFRAPELASVAIAALNGREVGGKKLEARLAEGVSQGGGFSSRSGRRLAGGKKGGGGGGGGDTNQKGDGAGKASRSSKGHGAGSKSAASVSSVSPPAHAQGKAQARAPGLDSRMVSSGSRTPKEKEGPPVVVDGSVGRLKKEQTPVMVDGSSGKQGGHQRGSKH